MKKSWLCDDSLDCISDDSDEKNCSKCLAIAFSCRCQIREVTAAFGVFFEKSCCNVVVVLHLVNDILQGLFDYLNGVYAI